MMEYQFDEDFGPYVYYPGTYLEEEDSFSENFKLDIGNIDIVDNRNTYSTNSNSGNKYTQESNENNPNDINNSLLSLNQPRNYLKNVDFEIESNENTNNLKTKIPQKKIMRKDKPDGMRKKVKVHLLKYILYKLNHYISIYFPNEKRRFIKFSKNLTEKIDIEYNKNLNQKTLTEILIEDRSINEKRRIFNPYYNKELAEIVLQNPVMNNLMNKSINDLFSEFLSSSECKVHLGNIRKSESNEYYQKYEKLLCDYAFYFMRKKPNKKREN